MILSIGQNSRKIKTQIAAGKYVCGLTKKNRRNPIPTPPTDYFRNKVKILDFLRLF
jgi:hypothetical protein